MDDQTLIIDDDDRYSRMRLIAWWDQRRLAESRILVVGAGALGNEVLKNLALLGVGTIYLIDMDDVEASNLTRSVLFRESDYGKPKSLVAAARVEELNRDVTVIPVVGNVLHDIGLGLVRDVDVVIGCLDNREARLWVNRMCWKTNTPWVDGGIQEINGVAKVFIPPHGPCYECGMTENDYRLIQLRYSCPLLSQEDITSGRTPTAPTIASIIGGLQTQEALKLIHGLPVAEGSALVFNGTANQMYQTKYPFREDCLSHETYENLKELPLGHQDSLEELFQHIIGTFDEPERAELFLELDRDLVVSLDCSSCKISREIMLPASRVNQHEAVCQQCENSSQPVIIHQVRFSENWMSKKLVEFGIPAYDIVKICSQTTEQYFVLGKDRERVLGSKEARTSRLAEHSVTAADANANNQFGDCNG
ncbi:MAG TPA: ThiF family adenylyltransferase [Pirellulaceae bacterium]|nr:ThiF family adenylyltransferase [Pirellulaceae bacterium]HMO92337.1 ThiF family adenylyltransferase [Pirellulaceae bacterium]HMP69261.1 ThiF family adenylyltransferase [Pirellulaceae bacterium]